MTHAGAVATVTCAPFEKNRMPLSQNSSMKVVPGAYWNFWRRETDLTSGKPSLPRPMNCVPGRRRAPPCLRGIMLRSWRQPLR